MLKAGPLRVTSYGEIQAMAQRRGLLEERIGPERFAGETRERLESHHLAGRHIVHCLEDHLEVPFGDHAADGLVALLVAAQGFQRGRDVVHLVFDAEMLGQLAAALGAEAAGVALGQQQAEHLLGAQRAEYAVLLHAGDWRAAYRDRLNFELDVIVQMGFSAYFLIVADFIKWAKDHDIPVGPGRGSGAGSVVAWSLTITDLDPMKLGLLFERFLNPERVSMPDFDIDFCETRRGEVIDYVQERYGRDQVAQIITFGKLKARAVLKDTGRVLQMSYGQVDRLAKLVPNHPTDPWTLDRALNGVSELRAEYRGDSGVKHLLDLAMKLEGLPRHA